MTATASILPSTSHRHIVQPTTIPDAPVFFRHPPILTNAVHLFDVVHLSPLDQQDIDGFSSTVAGPLDIIEVEEKRFDIICLDFGPQIFLQQPQLLRLVLAGLDSPQIGRQAQNLEYLERIVDAWRSMLRAFLVSSVAPDVVTPLRTTPNPSIDGVSQWAHQETNAGFDQAISLPYASHEIFVKLVALLRPTVLCSQALRVIERLIPFIKIHIETAISHTSRELNPHRLPELCHFYFHQLVSQTRYFDLQRGPTGELLFDHELASPVLEHQVVLLAVRAVWMFSDLDERPANMVPGLLAILLRESGHPTLIDHLVAWALQSAYDQALPLLQWLLTISPAVTVSQSIIRRLHTLLRSATYPQNAVVASDIACMFLHVKIAEAPPSALELTTEAARVMAAGLTPQQMLSQSAALLAFSGSDPALARRVFDACSTSWSSDDCALFVLRGLFHRNEGVSAACTALLRHVGSRATKNPFMFQSTFLSRVSVELASADMSIGDAAKALSSARAAGGLSPVLIDELVAMCRQNSSGQLAALVETGGFDDLCALLAAADSSSMRAEEIIRCIVVLRTFCETVRAARRKVRDQMMGSLVKMIDAKFDLARLCFVVVFCDLEDAGSARSNDGLGGADPKGSLRPQLLCLPRAIYEAFHVYGPTQRQSEGQAGSPELDMATCELVWSFLQEYPSLLHSAAINEPSTICQFTAAKAAALAEAPSHKEFRDAMLALALVGSLDTTRELVQRTEYLQPVFRIITTTPFGAEDLTLLSDALRFLRESDIRTPECLSAMRASIKSVLVPLLQGSLGLSDQPAGDAAGMGWGDMRAWVDAEIVAFINWALGAMHTRDIAQLASSTLCIPVLKHYTHQLFASEMGHAKKHRERINCLSALAVFASLPTLMAAITPATAADMIRLLVQIIGYSQQNYVNSTHGSQFTYKDRSVYRWVALCLRNLSRTAIAVSSLVLPWGDHWLFGGDLDWLLGLLHDDEKTMQKFGLGIIGNLILMNGSSVYLAAKIPQFIDMAFSFALDPEQSSCNRKEALIIINNFTVAFCHGTAENLASSSSEMPGVPSQVGLTSIASSSAGVVGSQVDATHTSTGSAYRIGDLAKIFEGSGFFDQLADLMPRHRRDLAMLEALSELLLNLAAVLPAYVGAKMLTPTPWSLLFEHAQLRRTIDELDPLSRAGGWLGQHRDLNAVPDQTHGDSAHAVTPTLRLIEAAHWRRVYERSALQIVASVLRSVHLLVFDSESLRNMLLGHTDLLNFIDQAACDLWLLLGEASGGGSSAGHHASIADAGWDAAAAIFGVLSAVLIDASALNPAGLCRMFSHKSGGEAILQFAAIALERRDNAAAYRSAHLLLARLFSLHFGEVVPLNLESLFETPAARGLPRLLARSGTGSGNAVQAAGQGGATATNTASTSIGSSILSSLLRFVVRDIDIADQVLVESVRLALQCLLGRCEFAKQGALAAQLPKQLVQKSRQTMMASSNGKLDDNRQNELFLAVSLLRHLFAGSSLAKVIPLFAQILLLREAREHLVLETLGCMCNLAANHDLGKRAIVGLKHATAGSRPPSSSSSAGGAIDAVLKVIKDPAQPLSEFLACIEVLKLLVLEKSCRTVLFKIGALADMSVLLAQARRVRDTARAEAIMQLFVNTTFSTDGQTGLLRIAGKHGGMTQQITEMLGSKSQTLRRAALLLLRNVALVRENKAHLLAHGETDAGNGNGTRPAADGGEDGLLDLIRVMLESKSLRLLAPASSFVWVLLYDSEKAKTAFKQAGLASSLERLEARLRHEHASHLGGGAVHSSRSDGGTELPREEAELLMETLRNTSQALRHVS
ncbi:hypothetical protein HK105_202559 [Polyrhizophydium stewartii]|uniref:Rotatin N-terminal domain-containing protein n=1 Tax=Polyrhizophydium stewartii TaxID=2732419 RepID=A0ABR4NDZ5_9FUNG